jgi:hypothetical protein
MSDQSLFRVDSVTVDGQAWAFVDGTAKINGAGDYTATVVTSGSGPDFEQYARVPRTIEMEIQFGPKVSPEDIKKIRNARVVLKDTKGPRRCLANNCSYSSMGPVGAGPVSLVLNVLVPYQWL